MNEFEKCLKNRKIVSSPGIQVETKPEFKAAVEDLKDAKALFRQNRFKYATIAGYYSLFHSARALLYSKGYREKSHYCLRVAIAELFVKEKILDFNFLDFFDEAIGLREAADYENVFSKDGAKRVIKNAEKFLSTVKEILKI